MVLKELNLYCNIPDIIKLGVEKEVLRKANLMKVKQNNKKFLSRYTRSTLEIKMSSFSINDKFHVSIVEGYSVLGNAFVDGVTICEILDALKSKLQARTISFYLKQKDYTYERIIDLLFLMSYHDKSTGKNRFRLGGSRDNKHTEDTNINFIEFEPETGYIDIHVVDPSTKQPESTTIHSDTIMVWDIIHRLV